MFMNAAALLHRAPQLAAGARVVLPVEPWRCRAGCQQLEVKQVVYASVSILVTPPEREVLQHQQQKPKTHKYAGMRAGAKEQQRTKIMGG